MISFAVGACGLALFFVAGFVVVVFSAADTGDGVGAIGGDVVELLTFVALFDGGWRPGLLHSVLEKVHVESFVEKAG